MPTTTTITTARAAADMFKTICRREYGVTLTEADELVVEWVYGDMRQAWGVSAAVSGLQVVNRERRRMGKRTVLPETYLVQDYPKKGVGHA